MRINPFIYGLLVLTIFLGTIFGFQAAGIWSTSGKVTASGEIVQPELDDVNTIKGWMTLGQITTVYNVPLEEIQAQFALPAGTTAETALKDLESDTFSVTELRDWLASRDLTEPVEGTDPTEAVDASAPTSAEATPTLTATSLPAQEGSTAPVETVLPTEHLPVAGTVTGKTTFQDLLDWGVPQSIIESIIGGPLPDASTVVKDYVTARGLDFASVKNALQAELP